MADNDKQQSDDARTAEGKGQYVVLAPLVQLKVRDAAGAWVYVQRNAGAVLDPDKLEIDETVLRSHLESGQIVERGDRVAEVFAVPAGTPLPGKPPNVAPSESRDSAGQPLPPLSADLLRAAEIDATGDEPYAAESTDRDDAERARQEQGDRLPRKNASEATWRDFHVQQQVAAGVPEDEARAEADSLDRDSLRARYQQ
jgi:hypothetical protein